MLTRCCVNAGPSSSGSALAQHRANIHVSGFLGGHLSSQSVVLINLPLYKVADYDALIPVTTLKHDEVWHRNEAF